MVCGGDCRRRAVDLRIRIVIRCGIRRERTSRRGVSDCPDCAELVIVPSGEFDMGSRQGPGAARSPRQDSQELRHRPPGRDIHRMGPVRRRGRLQVQSARSGLGAGRSPGDQRQLGRRERVHRVADKDDGKTLSAAHRGGVGICGARRVDDSLLVGQGGRGRDMPSARNAGEAKGQDRAGGSFRPKCVADVDTAGNAAEWVEDCWNPSYHGAPKRRTAWTSGDCSLRVLRGGSFADKAIAVRSSSRFAMIRTSAITPTAFG